MNQNKFNKQQAVVESNLESFGTSSGQRFANKNTFNKASAAVVSSVNTGVESTQPTADQVQEIGSQFFAPKNKANQQFVNSGIESEQPTVVGKNFIQNHQVHSTSNVASSVVSEAQFGVVSGHRVFVDKASTGSVQSASSEKVMQAKSGSFGAAKKPASQASFFSEVSPTGFAKLDAGNFF